MMKQEHHSRFACRGASTLGALVFLSLLPACWEEFNVCPVADDDMLALLPDRLSETGLYEDLPTGEISQGILPYRPQFELWSDGADKHRFLQIPAGTTIDTSDMDQWTFPVGTRVWKEFSRDGKRIETRMLERTGVGVADWAALAYVWNEDATDAIAAPTGFIDAGGTTHNVPAAGECIGCHGGRASWLLGVSAVQLSIDAADGDVDLEDLQTLGLLSHAPKSPIVVPGDETERAALGYLHANCGHCHNHERPEAPAAPCMNPNNHLDFWLAVDDLASPQATAAYESAREHAMESGEGEASWMIDRISTRGIWDRMPPLGTEIVDEDAVALLTRWLEGL